MDFERLWDTMMHDTYYTTRDEPFDHKYNNLRLAIHMAVLQPPLKEMVTIDATKMLKRCREMPGFRMNRFKTPENTMHAFRDWFESLDEAERRWVIERYEESKSHKPMPIVNAPEPTGRELCSLCKEPMQGTSVAKPRGSLPGKPVQPLCEHAYHRKCLYFRFIHSLIDTPELELSCPMCHEENKIGFAV